jgi:hypothetical protein
VEASDARQEPTYRGALFLLRAVLATLVIPALLVVAYAALSLQGHREDYPSQPMRTWPIGLSSLVLAAALLWVTARPSRGIQPLAVAAALVFFLLAWTALLL